MPVRAHRDLEIFSWSDRAGIGELLISELGTQSDLSSGNTIYHRLFRGSKYVL